jgi:plasmid stabilization system protein ParE
VTRRLVVMPEAKAQLNSLYENLAREASLDIATRYIDAVMVRIAGLADFPHRGTSRGDIRPGLRTIPFRRRLTIAYAVTPEEVRVIGIARAGQDLERLLGED